MTPEQFCYWLKGYLSHKEINLEVIQKELEATLTKKQVVPSLLDQYRPPKISIGSPAIPQQNPLMPNWDGEYQIPWEDRFTAKS